MTILAKPGDFCPNEKCPKYQKQEENPAKPNIIRAGKTKARAQRYECKTRHQTFTETKGTLFYRKQRPVDQLLETLALLADEIVLAA